MVQFVVGCDAAPLRRLPAFGDQGGPIGTRPSLDPPVAFSVLERACGCGRYRSHSATSSPARKTVLAASWPGWRGSRCRVHFVACDRDCQSSVPSWKANVSAEEVLGNSQMNRCRGLRVARGGANVLDTPRNHVHFTVRLRASPTRRPFQPSVGNQQTGGHIGCRTADDSNSRLFWIALTERILPARIGRR
jgi:hypothetical protein